jgi:hypothetical protein
VKLVDEIKAVRLFFSRGFEFVAGSPALEFRSCRGGAAEDEAEAGHFGETGKVPVGLKLVARLVVVVIDVVFGLGLAPGGVVAFEFEALADGERRDATWARLK